MKVFSLVAILSAGVGPVAAEPVLCYTVQPGDTAARVALRLTNDARTRHQPWFQIVDPRTSRVVSKADYGVIFPGWQVCLPGAMATVQSARVIQQPGWSASAWPATTHSVGRFGSSELAYVCGASLLLTALLAWPLARRSVDKRRAIRGRMTRFGERFIREFERPLVERAGTDRPLRSQLRCAPRRERLEILLAPHNGRQYPNLSDHRTNLEYDVGRVLRALGDGPFICGPLYARGSWVVIPFQCRVDMRKEGVS